MLTREPAIGRSQVEHQAPGRPKAMPKEKDPTHHYPFNFFFFLIGNQVPKAERVYFQARRAGMTTPARCCRRR